jgi:hypothetical protein
MYEKIPLFIMVCAMWHFVAGAATVSLVESHVAGRSGRGNGITFYRYGIAGMVHLQH